ncbi:hypothetical protein TIFTF001_047199 [Ficus carica]|uniref:Wall-associated receptor kinase galacturonan-binding domain-containing protein n=1 Tax=Ficus carica TaxID=3494 RepID=A0AA88CLH5_FICCA|nr:hypothetical protein TIFTF001_047199 [Ficus carica]
MVIEKLLVIVVACMLAKANALSVSETPLQIAKDNCEAQCGNVKIPFPFGIGSNCFIDKWFEVFCNKSTTPHRPFLKHTQWEVLDITDFYTDPYRYGGIQ